MKEYISNFFRDPIVGIAVCVISLAIGIVSLINLHQAYERYMVVNEIREKGITELGETKRLMPNMEGKYVYVSGFLDTNTYITQQVRNSRGHNEGEIREQCIWLKYVEEEYKKQGKSSSWVTKACQITHAENAWIDSIPLGKSLLVNPISQWKVIHNNESHDYRVTVSAFLPHSISCIAMVNNGKLEQIIPDYPWLCQTKAEVPIDTLLNDYIHVPLDLCVTCAAIFVCIVLAFVYLRNPSNDDDRSVELSSDIREYINQLNKQRMLYLGIMALCIISLELLFFYFLYDSDGIILSLISTIGVPLLASIFLYQYLNSKYCRQYKNTIIKSQTDRRDFKLSFADKSDFSRGEMAQLGFLGNMRDEGGFFAEELKYEMKTEDCFSCTHTDTPFQFFECTVNKTEGSGKHKTTTCLLQSLTIKMAVGISNNIELFINSALKTVDQLSLPRLDASLAAAQASLPKGLWKGSPKETCEELISNTQLVKTVGRLYDKIEERFGHTNIILQIKNSTLYIFISTTKDSFDPSFTDSLSANTVIQDLNTIDAMCSIVAVSKELATLA